MKSYWRDYYGDAGETEYGEDLTNEVPRRVAAKMARLLSAGGREVVASGVAPLTALDAPGGGTQLIGTYQALVRVPDGKLRRLARSFVAFAASREEAERALRKKQALFRAARGASRRRMARTLPRTLADAGIRSVQLGPARASGGGR